MPAVLGPCAPRGSLVALGHVEARDHDRPGPRRVRLDALDLAPLAAVLAGRARATVSPFRTAMLTAPPGRAR